MSTNPKPTPEFYVTGGTIRPGSESYIVRQADEELFQALRLGEFCYVLTTRQMGKSSLMARTAERLAEIGFRSAQVDLTLIGADEKSISSGQWYFGVAHRISRELGIDASLSQWWKERELMPDVQLFTEFLESLVLGQCSERIVIFVDEIDSTIGLSFSDDFFAAVRACYNLRPRNPAFERLTFVLLGVATPSQLISDPSRTPFNIGRGIELTDFTMEEAGILGVGFNSQNRREELLKRVLHWTGGHPYLTQALCRAVAESEEQEGGVTRDGAALVDELVQEKFLSPQATQEEKNLKFVRGRLRQGHSDLRKLLALYLRVLGGRSVTDRPASPLYASLKLAGVVKTDHRGYLRVRNRIYEHVFDRQWVRREMPTNVIRLVTAVAVGIVIATFAFGYVLLERSAAPFVQTLRSVPSDDEIAYTAYSSLHNNLLYRARAAILFATFWEGREDRDRALLTLLQGLNEKDSVSARRYAADLIGHDYEGLLVTFRHGNPVKAIALSPDGKTVVSVDTQGIVQLWNTETGEPIGVPMEKHALGDALAFSPDSRIVATVSLDGTTKLWDVKTGSPIGRPLQTENMVSALAFRQDGKVLATGTWDTTRLWNVNTGKPMGVAIEHNNLAALAFRPDGKVLATVEQGENTARFWSASTGKPIGLVMKHADSINAVAFSPNSKLFATASSDNTARLWSAETGKPIGAPMKHHDPLWAILFSPDSRLVATGSQDNTARLWAADSGVSKSLPLLHRSTVFALAFSPDGKTLVTGSADRYARLWDVETGSLRRSPLMEGGYVTFIAFSPDGKKLLTGSNDITAHLWRTDAGIPLGSTDDQPQEFSGYSISQDGTKVIAVRNGEARLWMTETGKPIGPVLPHPGRVIAVAMSLDGQLLATAGEDKTARLWRADTGAPVGSPMIHQGEVSTVSFDKEGHTLMTGSTDATARLWDTANGNPLGPPLQQGNKVVSIGLNASQHIAITGGVDGSARLWRTDTGKQLHVFQQGALVVGAALSPDGEFALTTGQDGSASLWRINDGSRITSLRYRSRSQVWGGFSQDGTSIGFADSNWYFIRSWDGRSLQLLAAGMWQSIGVQDINQRDGTHWQFRHSIVGGKGFVITPASEPVSAPLGGKPKDLMDEWKRRLGLTFDSQGRIVKNYSRPSSTVSHQ